MKKLSRDEQLVWDILSTPDNVDFKKYRETHDTTWLTQSRQIVWIEEMETKHIIACINMLERCGQEYTAAYNGLINELGTRHKDKDLWEWEDEN